MAKIVGTVVCNDTMDICEIHAGQYRNVSIICVDNLDLNNNTGYVISTTKNIVSPDSTFIQGQMTQNLTLSFNEGVFKGWVLSDSTYIDGTYQNIQFNPISINYSIYKSDISGNILQGYRYRSPINSSIGNYFANMVIPQQPGNYIIQWCYKKDESSFSTIVNQPFKVKHW